MTDRHVEELEAAASYQRERLALYRARVYGPGLTSPVRLRKLEQASHHADERLLHARREATQNGKSKGQG